MQVTELMNIEVEKGILYMEIQFLMIFTDEICKRK